MRLKILRKSFACCPALIKHIRKPQLFILSQPTCRLIMRNHLLKNQMDGMHFMKQLLRVYFIILWNSSFILYKKHHIEVRETRPRFVDHHSPIFLYGLHDGSKRVAWNFQTRGAMISGFRKVGCDVVTASVMVTVYETANCWATIVNICGVQHMERHKQYYGARLKDQIKILKKR